MHVAMHTLNAEVLPIIIDQQLVGLDRAAVKNPPTDTAKTIAYYMASFGCKIRLFNRMRTQLYNWIGGGPVHNSPTSQD